MDKGDGFGFLFFLCAACIWHKVRVFENETGLFLLVAWLCLCNNGRTRNVLTFVNTTAIAYRQNSAF